MAISGRTRIISPLPDHARRLILARGLADEIFGGADYVDDVLGSYFLPTSGGDYGHTPSAVVLDIEPAKTMFLSAQNLPKDAVSPFSDHEQRLEVARNTAYYALGLDSAADTLVDAYFAPSTVVSTLNFKI
jgi:hypothetical protein